MATDSLDPEGKYKKSYLKEYKHWILSVSSHQHTLGCYIIIAKRNIEKVSEANGKELEELVKVMSDIEKALLTAKEFKPDRFNYLQLGNGWHHLHFHGIPRYETPRFFDGKEWIDKEWGKPPIWNYEKIPDEFIKKLKDAILKYLPK